MKKISSIYDIFVTADEYYHYLERKGMRFTEDGFPVFERKMFLTEWPEMVVTFSKRTNKLVVNREKTLICFFDKDDYLYPRLSRVLDDLEEYKKFMGVVALDITITDDMDKEWQRGIALLNQLFLAILAVNGIKIVINSRTAGMCANNLFSGVPQNVMVASGFLGCTRLSSDYDFSYIEKIIALMPEKLIIYGKHDIKAEKQLDAMGINYRIYPDVHKLCKEVHHG